MSAPQGGSQISAKTGSPRITSGFWARAKTQSKVGFDKLWATADKLGDPVNKLSNKIGSEAFWPTTIDKESEKAARILRSFCKDGFYEEEVTKTPDGPQQKQRVLKRIPASVIQNARGLAIFTTMRTGLWVSGAGGSGILVGRKDDGSWSQPCGIMLHTAGLGFLVGVDIYDCVLVLNTPEALAAFSRWRCTVGGEISAVAGPAGVGGVLETELHKRQAAIFTYLKSRGFYAGVQIDGTVVIERTDENERFYGEKISAKEILAGRAQSREPELKMLMATLKAAEGDSKVDSSLLPSEPPPADMQVVADGQLFGVPDREDPDPYGVHALEKEGFVIKEAGTHTPADTDQFDFHPSITSPVYDTFRRSGDTMSRRGSWRSSIISSSTAAEREKERDRPRYVTNDSATQTDFPPVNFPSPKSAMNDIREIKEVSPTRSARSPLSHGLGIQVDTMHDRGTLAESTISSRGANELPGSAEAGQEHVSKAQPAEDPMYEQQTPTATFHDQQAIAGAVKEVPPEPETASDSGSGNDDDDDEEEPVIVHEAPVVHQVSQAARPQVVTRAKVTTVAVPKRGPPPTLPPRHPARKRSFGANSAQTSDSEAPDNASISSFRSSGKPPSVRSSRAKSGSREDNVSTSTTAVQSPNQTPAEEKANPVEDDTAGGQVEPMPVRGMQPAPLNSTPRSARRSTEVSPVVRPRPNIAATVRQNSGSGSVSALKSRFETTKKTPPPPISTTSVNSRPTSSHSNSNRSSSPLKQLSTYTTTEDERKARRISPLPSPRAPSPLGSKPDEVDVLPGAFPSDSFDGASDPKPALAAAAEQPQLNGFSRSPSPTTLTEVEPPRSLRTGRSPLEHLPNEQSSTNGASSEGEAPNTGAEQVTSPPRSPRKGPSLVGLRNSLHPMRDDDSDIGSRSRSMSPVKTPIKVDTDDDFS